MRVELKAIRPTCLNVSLAGVVHHGFWDCAEQHLHMNPAATSDGSTKLQLTGMCDSPLNMLTPLFASNDTPPESV